MGRDSAVIDKPYYDHRERYKKVIKTCPVCGFTKRDKLYVNECVNCGNPWMAFFKDINHIVRFIDVNGVKNLKIVDQALLDDIIVIFNETKEE